MMARRIREREQRRAEQGDDGGTPESTEPDPIKAAIDAMPDDRQELLRHLLAERLREIPGTPDSDGGKVTDEESDKEFLAFVTDVAALTDEEARAERRRVTGVLYPASEYAVTRSPDGVYHVRRNGIEVMSGAIPDYLRDRVVMDEPPPVAAAPPQPPPTPPSAAAPPSRPVNPGWRVMREDEIADHQGEAHLWRRINDLLQPGAAPRTAAPPRRR